MLSRMLLTSRRIFSVNTVWWSLPSRGFKLSAPRLGIKDFFDPDPVGDQVMTTGRCWTVPDLRRKSYEDLHKLWFVLYKERNVLLTLREKIRRAERPITNEEESRYIKVKRSMAAIKTVINERKTLEHKLNPPPEDHNKTPGRRTPVFYKKEKSVE